MAREKREDLGVQKRAYRRGEQQRMARADGDDSRGISVAFAHLDLGIVVVGDWLPRSIFGRVIALCSTLWMLYLALYVVLMAAKALIDIVICDDVSAPLPTFRGRFPTLFAPRS